MCSGTTGDLSVVGSLPMLLTSRFLPVGAEVSCICLSSARWSPPSGPSGAARMITSGAVISGGLIALSSARTGDAGAEGVGWPEGVGVAEGTSKAGLRRNTKLNSSRKTVTQKYGTYAYPVYTGLVNFGLTDVFFTFFFAGAFSWLLGAVRFLPRPRPRPLPQPVGCIGCSSSVGGASDCALVVPKAEGASGSGRKALSGTASSVTSS